MAETKKPKKTSTKKVEAPKEERAGSLKKKAEQSPVAANAKTERTVKPPQPPSKPAPAPHIPLMSKTYFMKDGENRPNWILIDATQQPLGRLASLIAMALMGKNKPTYTRHVDSGDYVIVINARRVLLTGTKWVNKVYQYHTNYPGGLKTISARQQLEQHPERLIQWAVYGMLPRGHMGRKWYSKLKVYPDDQHPHRAQTPQPLVLSNRGERNAG